MEPIRMTVKGFRYKSTYKKISCKESKGIGFQKKELSNIKHNKKV